MQPSHAIGDLHFAYKRLGYERLNNAYPWRNLLDLGVVIAGGSDAPVEIGDPRIEFKAAISRKDLDGFHDVGWHLEQAVTREEALKMFTICLQLLHLRKISREQKIRLLTIQKQQKL